MLREVLVVSCGTRNSYFAKYKRLRLSLGVVEGNMREKCLINFGFEEMWMMCNETRWWLWDVGM